MELYVHQAIGLLTWHHDIVTIVPILTSEDTETQVKTLGQSQADRMQQMWGFEL